MATMGVGQADNEATNWSLFVAMRTIDYHAVPTVGV